MKVEEHPSGSCTIIYYDGSICYYNSRGALHRIDGPAIEKPDGRHYYAFDGSVMSFENFLSHIGDEDMKCMLILSYNG